MNEHFYFTGNFSCTTFNIYNFSVNIHLSYNLCIIYIHIINLIGFVYMLKRKADGEESEELSPGLAVRGSVSGLWAMTLHTSPHCSLRARPSVEAEEGLSLLLRCGL